MMPHFSDLSVGGVAGNVKVGNRVNAITRLQALEYAISQSVDRRAFEYLNAITVVPGALGAWRIRALDVAGWCFLAGILIFSGLCYALALGGPKYLGAIVPMGGVAFIVGWVALAVGALRKG